MKINRELYELADKMYNLLKKWNEESKKMQKEMEDWRDRVIARWDKEDKDKENNK